MRKLIYFWGVLFFAVNGSLLADQQNFAKEQTILTGLSNKSSKEQVKFLEMAKLANSAAVFEKLSQMYRVNDSVKENVFYAMQWMNINNNGIFSSKFADAVKKEFFRLKTLELASKPHVFYLMTCLSIFQEKPFPGYDAFVNYIIQNIDQIMDNAASEHVDPLRLKKETLGECVFYFAKREQPGYMSKLADVFIRNEISEQLSIIELFTSKSDSSIFESFTQKLLQQSEDEYSGDLFNAYKAYAASINKPIPETISKHIKQYEQLCQQKIENILQDY